MNIFILDEDPIQSAKMYCDKHVPKLVVEIFQMLGSSVIRHGATPDMMPLTSKGTPLRGGYHNHPCTRWVGDSRSNFLWACYHGAMLCDEYTKRFGKVHSCERGIEYLYTMAFLIPEGELTPFALAMPDEYRPKEPSTSLLDNDTFAKQGVRFNADNEMIITHAVGEDAVQAYRDYYIHDKSRFAQWKKGRDAPEWWPMELIQ